MSREGIAGPTALAAIVGFCAVLGLAIVGGSSLQPPPVPTISLPDAAPPAPSLTAQP